MYPSEADLALLERYSQQHDEEAFAEIVQRYASVVYAACHRILGDRARAEEVAQEAFFRLLQKPDSVTRSLGGWLHRTATQLAIDVARSDSARRKRELKFAQSKPKEVSDWDDLSPLIDEALTELPDEMRSLLVRHFLQGKSQAALAVEGLTSPATISRRIKAGLEELRTKLRSKGVLASVALLASFFAEGVAEAAPEALMAELGKMAMISGSAPAIAAASQAAASKAASAVAIAFAAAAIAIIVVAIVAMFATSPRGTQPATTEDPAVPATVSPPASSK